MRRGFVLGKFMPPHAGHMMLCDTAQRLVDELTILVCWLPDDPIPGLLRLQWMRELFPNARVIGHGAPVPQAPDDHPDFWAIWRSIVREVHPGPIDLLFAGEPYGLRLASEVGAEFVPIGNRELPVSGTAVRANPWRHWQWLAPVVRAHFTRTFCLHGPESTGKTRLAERLAKHFGTIWVPEYGRSHCEVHGLDIGAEDLKMIAAAQRAMVAASLPWCNGRLILDTDALMTAAWSEMLMGSIPEIILQGKRADLYLLLDIDVPWQDDGTRFFGDAEQRRRFMDISGRLLDETGAQHVRISGNWDQRFEAAVAAIEAVPAPTSA